jgi:cytosine/adenosine deaminase-related metal-dependent hydrolase
MLNEVRQALLLARLNSGIKGASRSAPDAPPLMTARQALSIATRGGASVLGRQRHRLTGGRQMRGFFAMDLRELDYTGAIADPLATILFCQPIKANWTVVGGEIIVREGQLTRLNIQKQVEKHNQAAKRLLQI